MNPPFKLLFKKSAEKELLSIPSSDLKRILRKAEGLASHPRPHDAKMLKGVERYLRIRQGDYRIVYEVRDDEGEVVIIKIGHRCEVYD